MGSMLAGRKPSWFVLWIALFQLLALASAVRAQTGSSEGKPCSQCVSPINGYKYCVKTENYCHTGCYGDDVLRFNRRGGDRCVRGPRSTCHENCFQPVGGYGTCLDGICRKFCPAGRTLDHSTGTCVTTATGACAKCNAIKVFGGYVGCTVDGTCNPRCFDGSVQPSPRSFGQYSYTCNKSPGNPSAAGVGQAQATRRAKKRDLAQDCPSNQTKCEASGSSSNFECVDTESSLSNCGSCGNDCLQADGVSEARCFKGRCVAVDCKPGYERRKETCIPSFAQQKAL